MTHYRILFFALIPAGVILLIFAIRFARKSFGGKILAEMPFLQKTASFRIDKAGTYAVWQKGQYFRKLPVDQFRPEIICRETGEKIRLFPSLFRPNSNDGVTFKMELFRFTAQPGNYLLTIVEGSSISTVERFVSHLFPAKKADISQYYLLIRESQPFYFLIAGILLICLSAFLMIGGLVAGILTK